MHSGLGAGLILIVALAAGCSSSSALDHACIPELTCKTHLELIEEPAGCSTCASCAGDWGSCSSGGLACKRGQLDLSTDSPSCETAIADASAEFVLDSTGSAAGRFTINEDETSADIAATALVFDEVDSSCLPTFDTPCPYTVRSMQFSIGDFTIEPKDTLSWKNGTLTLTGPVAASDDGTAVGVQSVPVVLSFEVSGGSEHRLAVASGTASVGVVIDYRSLQATSVTLEATGFDFGGYHIEDIFFNGIPAAR